MAKTLNTVSNLAYLAVAVYAAFAGLWAVVVGFVVLAGGSWWMHATPRVLYADRERDPEGRARWLRALWADHVGMACAFAPLASALAARTFGLPLGWALALGAALAGAFVVAWRTMPNQSGSTAGLALCGAVGLSSLVAAWLMGHVGFWDGPFGVSALFAFSFVFNGGHVAKSSEGTAVAAHGLWHVLSAFAAGYAVYVSGGIVGARVLP